MVWAREAEEIADIAAWGVEDVRDIAAWGVEDVRDIAAWGVKAILDKSAGRVEDFPGPVVPEENAAVLEILEKNGAFANFLSEAEEIAEEGGEVVAEETVAELIVDPFVGLAVLEAAERVDEIFVDQSIEAILEAAELAVDPSIEAIQSRGTVDEEAEGPRFESSPQ